MEHEELLEIARIISDGDEAVLKEMSGCLKIGRASCRERVSASV